MPIGILLSQKWYKNLVELTFEVELFPYNSITSFHHSGETKHKDGFNKGLELATISIKFEVLTPGLTH